MRTGSLRQAIVPNHLLGRVMTIAGVLAWSAIPVGTRIPVPNFKMKWDAGNPTGHGIIFIGTQGQVFCYVTPGGI